MGKGLFISLFGHAVIVGVTAYNGLMVDSDKTASAPDQDSIGDSVRMVETLVPNFTRHLVIGGETLAPVGAYDFCERRADLCTFGINGEFLKIGKYFSEDKLDEVNTLINTSYAPSSDDDTFGQNEFWYIPDAEGEPETGGRADCEDYALAKRKMLIERGWPAEDLYMSFVLNKARNNEGHAILVARVPGTNDYYGLDNLSETLLSLEQINELYSMTKVNVGAINTWRTATLELQPPA